MGTGNELKERVVQELERDARIRSIEQTTGYDSRSAWKIELRNSTKIIWVTYSRFAGDPTTNESPFYGSTWDSMTSLRRDHPLYLVFLGATDEHRWTIPFADFVSRFDISERRDDSAWRFNFDHGNNREILPEYRGIQPLFDY